MKTWLLLISVFGLAVSGRAELHVSPASITTGLRWDNVAGGLYSYAGTTLTVTGNSGAVTWTIKDQNGTTITTLSASGGKTLGWPSKSATPPDHTAVFGQIDCTGSAADTTCVYNAPAEYPPGETATLDVSDGAGSAAVVVNFTFAYNLQEYFKHRARMLGTQSKPIEKLTIAANPLRYQPELLIFQSGPLPDGNSYEYQIVQNDSDVSGAGFPATGGSMINRPAWSYDGKWFSWDSRRCVAGAWCGPGQDSKFIAQTDGSNLQPLVPGPVTSNFTYGYNKPNWLISSDASNIYVIDLANGSKRTSVATYSAPVIRRIFSQVTGPYAQFKETNPNSFPAPNVYLYDLSSCEQSLTGRCASIYSRWNLNLNLTFGWDGGGHQHCTIDGGGSKCEYHAHDFYLRRNTTNSIWNYGSGGDVGEGIFFQASADGTKVTALYPDAVNNVPYLSHPAFNWSGDLIAYGGPAQCLPTGQNSCSSDQPFGSGIWDTRSNKAVVFTPGIGYAHSAWDGFDNNHFGHDGHGGGSCPTSHWCLQSSTVDYKAGAIQDTTVLDFGTRDQNKGGDHSFGVLYSPTQSPDATKLAQSMRTSFSVANQALGWIVVVKRPAPPVSVSLASSTSATLNWLAPALNHEAKAYHVYKQASCRGSWERLADVNTVYLQQTPYSTTDGGLGPGQSACYGITTEEWTGTESQGLSEVLKITNAAGTFSAEKVHEAGTMDFDRSAPVPPSGFRASLERLSPPGAPYRVEQAKGGPLLDGKYSVRLAYSNYSDFPANGAANARSTPAGPARSATIAGGNGTAALAITGQNSEAYGQTAVQIYACGPEPFQCPETLQATVELPMPPNATPGQLNYTLKTLAAGAAPPAANWTLHGHRLKWTAPPDNDVRYFALYSRDDQAPPLLHTDAYTTQQYLIATVPAGYNTFLDYLANGTRMYKATGGPYYGIVAVDRQGHRSAPVCLRADTGASVPCN